MNLYIIAAVLCQIQYALANVSRYRNYEDLPRNIEDPEVVEELVQFLALEKRHLISYASCLARTFGFFAWAQSPHRCRFALTLFSMGCRLSIERGLSLWSMKYYSYRFEEGHNKATQDQMTNEILPAILRPQATAIYRLGLDVAERVLRGERVLPHELMVMREERTPIVFVYDTIANALSALEVMVGEHDFAQMSDEEMLRLADNFWAPYLKEALELAAKYRPSSTQ